MRCLQQNKAAHPSLSGAGPCTVCIMLQRINHSYPVSNCIYHQRPGCSGILAQEDDQTRRSKQYPVQAVGGAGEDSQETLSDLSLDYFARAGRSLFSLICL